MRVYILSMEFRKLISKRLREARLAKGYTQEQLAQISGIHLKAIAKYETEVIIPTAETLKKLSEALEVSSDYFLFPQARMNGIPKVQDPDLYEQYFVLEALDETEREAALTLLKALIASHKLRELTATLPDNKPQNGKKQNKHAAT